MITKDEAVNFILHRLGDMEAGLVYVPRLPGYRLADLAEALYPGRTLAHTGLRPGGEKLHESLLSDEELNRVNESPETAYAIILPSFKTWEDAQWCTAALDTPGDYNSRTAWRLTVEELREICRRHS